MMIGGVRSLMVVVLVSACVDQSPHIDPVGDDAFVSAADRAAHDWTRIGCPIEVSRGSLPVVQTNEWNPQLEQYGGFTDSHHVAIRADLPADLVYPMILHELGHVLGYQHGDSPVMEPVVLPDLTLTAADCR